MREIWAKIRYLFRRESHAWALDEELEAHLEMEIEANIERGMSPEEARRLARREFGNTRRLRESAQEAWLFHRLESVLQDVRYALRQFRRGPGVFLAIVVSLAIGLGSSTAIFSLIEAAVLRPLPVADPDRLIHLHWRNDQQPAGVIRVQRSLPGSVPGGPVEASNVAEPIFRSFAEQQTGFSSLIGVYSDTDEIAVSASPDTPAEQVRALFVSRNFFDGLGIPPILGRSFVDEEDRQGAEPSAIVSHRFWSSRLRGDPDVIGEMIRIDGEPVRVVGVAPPGFFGLRRGLWVDLYLPLLSAPAVLLPGYENSNWTVDMVARLPSAVSGSDAATAMTPLFRNLVAEVLGTEVEEELELFAQPAAHGLWWGSPRIDEVSQALRILMLLVSVLLLIVCANVANLLLSRSARRQRESAVRLALGAGRWRLIRQHLVESGMLAIIGGAVGLGIGIVLARAIHAFFQAGQSSSDVFAVTLDWRLVGYSTAVTLATVLLFGLAPAWTAARPKVSDELRIQSRSVFGGGLRIPRLLVSAQFALSFAALVAAGLLGRSLGNLYATDLGFSSEQLSYATVHPDRAGYERVDLGSYIERLQQELAAIPRVVAVAPLNERLLDGRTMPGPVYLSPREDPSVPAAPDMTASVVATGPGIVDALGLQLLAGRALEAGDGERCSGTRRPGVVPGGLCPVLIDQRFAETLFPGENAIGQRFEAAFAGESIVVGVVANAREDLREEGMPTLYQPYGVAQGLTLSGTHFAIRARIDSSALAAAVRQAVARVDAAVPLAEFHTQTGLVDRLLRTERLLALVSGAFTLAALVLAAVGLGGLLAYGVALRTNEIGVRMALGATGSEVRRIVLGDSLRMVGVGILIGIPAAYAVGRYLESLLFGLQPMDPKTVVLALVALFAIASIASLLPARRAAGVNPMTALRDERKAEAFYGVEDDGRVGLRPDPRPHRFSAIVAARRLHRTAISHERAEIVTGLTADLRHAVAVYRSTPIASGIAVVALAVAMASVSAFLSMWSDLSLKPPEGFQRDALVTIGQSGGYTVADSSTPLTLASVEQINETVGSLESATGIATFSQLLHLDGETQAVQAEAVTRHFGDLRPRLALGRHFNDDEHYPESEPAVILSHRLWLDRFGGREDIVGESIRISEVRSFPANFPGNAQAPEVRGQDYRIVGVMSPRMTGTFVDTTDIWLPYEQAVPFLYGDPDEGPQINLGLTGSITTTTLGTVPTRMRGLAIPAAGAGTEAIGNELNARIEIENQSLIQGLNLSGEEIRLDVIAGVVGDIGIQRESQRQVRLFLGGTLLLVVVAACNISLFMLARASRRQRELGIRMAVGAPFRRLARQLTSEAGLLMFAATVLGVLLSLWLSAVLRELPFLQQAEWREVSPFDWRVLLMLCGLMFLLTLLVSLAPILGLRKMGIRASSAMVKARAGWGQRTVGTVQIAMTGIVGAVAVAFAWHLYFYATVDRGFDPENVLVVELNELRSFSVQAPSQMSLAIERERQRDIVAGLPGVENASFANFAPGGAGTLPYTVVQRPSGNYVEIATVQIDDHYFELLGIPLLHGQNIDPLDRTQIVFNETYAVSSYGRVDAVGEVSASNRTVRGIVPDIALGHPAEEARPTGFVPYARTSYPLLLIKTRSTPAAMRELLQQKIDAGELEIDLAQVDRLENIVGRTLRADRARAILTASSALLVLVLAALGFYGTQRYLVTAGQREYAIRSAIGAGPRSLGTLVLSRGMGLALPGLAFGIVLAFLVVAWLREGFVVRAVSPVSVSLALALVILGLIFAASFGPALQARRTLPAGLLRVD